MFFFGKKRVPFQLIGLFSGFGAGASFNKLADDFNRIQRREDNIKKLLRGEEEELVERIDLVKDRY